MKDVAGWEEDGKSFYFSYNDDNKLLALLQEITKLKSIDNFARTLKDYGFENRNIPQDNKKVWTHPHFQRDYVGNIENKRRKKNTAEKAESVEQNGTVSVKISKIDSLHDVVKTLSSQNDALKAKCLRLGDECAQLKTLRDRMSVSYYASPDSNLSERPTLIYSENPTRIKRICYPILDFMILILCFVQYFFGVFVEIISGNAMPIVAIAFLYPLAERYMLRDAVVIAAITAHFLREIHKILRDNTTLIIAIPFYFLAARSEVKIIVAAAAYFWKKSKRREKRFDYQRERSDFS